MKFPASLLALPPLFSLCFCLVVPLFPSNRVNVSERSVSKRVLVVKSNGVAKARFNQAARRFTSCSCRVVLISIEAIRLNLFNRIVSIESFQQNLPSSSAKRNELKEQCNFEGCFSSLSLRFLLVSILNWFQSKQFGQIVLIELLRLTRFDQIALIKLPVQACPKRPSPSLQ